MQKVIINAALGGNEKGVNSGNILEKDFNLKISKEIYARLRALGVDAYLVRDDDSTLNLLERLDIINSYVNPNDEVIILTNMLASGNDQGAEVIYALRNQDTLANEISLNIENAGQNILKYYQLRDPSNTSRDFYDIIKETPDYESIIVSYGYPENQEDKAFLENNLEELGNGVALAINDYLKRSNLYTVQEGDTLATIAQKFKVQVFDLKEVNGLSGDSLVVGEVLLIPKRKTSSMSSNFNYYTVQSGDSLFKIARMFNTTINAIRETNNLTQATLMVGDILKIPQEVTSADEENYLIYSVKAGDSLYAIAKKYETTVSEIKNLNGLSSDNLAIGEKLKIPQELKPEQRIYTVKSGDSLYQIANSYKTSVQALKQLNNLTSNQLEIGQQLKIPS